MAIVEKNSIALWRDVFPVKKDDGHKYTSGHALVYGAPGLTGATRLAAQACARIGAGLVSVLCPAEAAAIYRASLPAHILVRDDPGWDDERVTARLYGPGGLPVEPDYNAPCPVVLDADALRADMPALSSGYVLTPHAGEFARLFPDLADTEREEAALEGARRLKAHLVLKGAETLIASPEGRLVRNDHASPYLASAGTGDVLAGMITGLLAQGMPVFEAVCAAVWIHGECGRRIGPGLVASDLDEFIPAVLRDIVT